MIGEIIRRRALVYFITCLFLFYFIFKFCYYVKKIFNNDSSFFERRQVHGCKAYENEEKGVDFHGTQECDEQTHAEGCNGR